MVFIVRMAINGLALLAVAALLRGISLETVGAVFWATVIWGVFNGLLRPVLRVLTLPVNIMTLGLFGLILNGFLFWSVALLVPGFVVDGFLWALAGVLLTTFISSLLALLLGVRKRRRR